MGGRRGQDVAAPVAPCHDVRQIGEGLGEYGVSRLALLASGAKPTSETRFRQTHALRESEIRAPRFLRGAHGMNSSDSSGAPVARHSPITPSPGNDR